MSVVAIIQARLSSTRLPKKVMLDIEGKTVLERVVERIIFANITDKVIVATSIDKSDDAIEVLCRNIGTDCYRGSLNDVLDRFYNGARKNKADHIVRITADCPLIDPEMVKTVVKTHLAKGADYTTNTLKETYPDGEDVEVMKFSALEKAWENAKLLSEREHVTPYIRNHPEIFSHESIENVEDLSTHRWTLDNPEDYEFIKSVFSHYFKKQIEMFGINNVLEFLQDNVEVVSINKHIKRNEGYAKSLQEDKEASING